MKKIIMVAAMALATAVVGPALSIVALFEIDSLNAEIDSLNAEIEYLGQENMALKRHIDAAIYKKDTQLALMNIAYGDENMHKLLADSLKNDCLKYKEKYRVAE